MITHCYLGTQSDVSLVLFSRYAVHSESYWHPEPHKICFDEQIRLVCTQRALSCGEGGEERWGGGAVCTLTDGSCSFQVQSKGQGT